MARVVFVLAVLLSAAASAETPEVAARARVRSIVLLAPPAPVQCALPVTTWPEAGDPMVLTGYPPARNDEQEAHAYELRGLVQLGFFAGLPQLRVLGAPARAEALSFSRTGWHARWPFC
jgi:hypothetical protein